jgi:beta-aspartyl-peptidase (threonine type)
MLAAEVIHGMQRLGVQSATEHAVPLIARVGGEAGCIAISAKGEIGWSHNSAQFVVAYQHSGQPEPKAWLGKSESLVGGPHAEVLIV